MKTIAAYCRVSTDKEDQANSFETQQHYFEEYINSHPDWTLYRIYADEGISGTGTKKRVQFNKMIQDAYSHKFELILTKEVSRFSRNILDTIYYTRALKAEGIGVYFVTDNINTMNPESEMVLSFLASLAQEESRRTSTRVVWGQTRQMEKGVVFGRSLLGYDVSNGALRINEEGARIVQLIFHKYVLEKKSVSQIAGFLSEKGHLTSRGNKHWNPTTVIRILRNEKYMGDLVQKKTYTPDYLNHEKKANNGKVPLIHIQGHHTPIVDKDLWNQAQELLDLNRKRTPRNIVSTGCSGFSGRIKCGECGSAFISRNKYQKDGNIIQRWGCSTSAAKGRKTCNVGKLIRQDDFINMVKTAIQHINIDHNAIISRISKLVIDELGVGEGSYSKQINRIDNEIVNLMRTKERMLNSYFSREITQDEMHTMRNKYNAIISQKEAEKLELDRINSISINQIETVLSNILLGRKNVELFYRNLTESLTVFREKNMELRLNHFPGVFYFCKQTYHHY